VHDNIFNFMFELVVVFFDQLKSVLFVAFKIFVDLQNSLNLLLFCCNDLAKDRKVVIIVCP